MKLVHRREIPTLQSDRCYLSPTQDMVRVLCRCCEQCSLERVQPESHKKMFIQNCYEGRAGLGDEWSLLPACQFTLTSVCTCECVWNVNTQRHVSSGRCLPAGCFRASWSWAQSEQRRGKAHSAPALSPHDWSPSSHRRGGSFGDRGAAQVRGKARSPVLGVPPATWHDAPHRFLMGGLGGDDSVWGSRRGLCRSGFVLQLSALDLSFFFLLLFL